MVKICSRCVMDSSILGIRFDEQGVCNFCKIHDVWEKRFPLDEMTKQRLNKLIDKIKSKGKNKKYDCVVGVSGGADSTYTLYMVKKLGLRPLAVHFDNGWNSEISVNNIKQALSILNIDLHTCGMDWEEFKDIQISFLKASICDVEIPTDLAIKSALHRVAAKKRIKYIITGASFRTEGKVPFSWGYGTNDGRYIKSVHKKFGKTKMKTFPNFTMLDRIYYNNIKKIKSFSLLHYIDYKKENAMRIIEKELGWKPYGYKHFESIYTRFIQSYLLPKKFDIDKRKLHFSALIRSDQMTQEEALTKLKEEDPYPKEKIKEDMDYVINKLGLTREEFEEMLSQPPKLFLDYPTYYPIIKALKIPLKLIYRSISDAPPTVFDEMRFFEEDIKKRKN